MTFELIDLILVVGICQGVFLSLTLQRITNTNKRANSTLSLLIAISTFMLLGRFLMMRFFSPLVFQWSLVFDVVIYLFGPVFYLYTRRLLFKEESLKPLSFYHYLPALVFFMMALGYVVAYSPEGYYQTYRDGNLNLMFVLVLITALLHNFIYLFLSFMMVRKFRRSEKRTVSFSQNPVRYITFFLMAIGVIMLAWLVGFVNTEFFGGYIAYIGYDAIWIAIPVFIYVIGYFSLKQPELFRMTVVQEEKIRRARLAPNEAQILQAKLDSLMQNEKIFLKGDLTLAEVAQLLKTSTNNLSWLLNNVYRSTFYDFINSHRVKEFVRKLENNEHLQHTFLALSMDVGFNSKSTFNKAFKNEMNDTPSNFIKKLRAA